MGGIYVREQLYKEFEANMLNEKGRRTVKLGLIRFRLNLGDTPRCKKSSKKA
jgi:hypothetical protein